MALKQLRGLIEQLQRVIDLVHIHREQLTKAPGARETLAQTEYMAGDVVHHATLGQMLLDVGAQLAQCLGATNHWCVAGKQLLIDLRQHLGVVISLATKHDAIEGLQMRAAFIQGLDPAVEDEFQLGEVLCELGRNFITQRRHLAVFLR